VRRTICSTLGSKGRTMAFEYPTKHGVLRLFNAGRRWVVEFDGRSAIGTWLSADDAVTAAVRHRTGLSTWDRAGLMVSDDLLRWRPVGENL
jgi:hypothetical protein